MLKSKDTGKSAGKDKEGDFKTSIGGQALIEGIMMRGPSMLAMVVRNKEELVEKTQELHPIRERYKVFGLPFIRGVVNFGSSMALGVSSLMFSADNMPEEEQEEPSKLDIWIEEKLGSERAEKAIITIGVVLGIALSVGLFMLLPTMLAGFVARYVESAAIRNITEGVIRILIFLTYLWGTSKISYMSRVWAYHGAEHKAIYCYEKKLPLTVENVKVQSTLHPRCGTSFMFIVMIISILVFSVVSWNNLLVRFALRLALLPVVVAISYEIIRFAGRYDNKFTSFISAPGKAMQKLTTKEPDDEMIEVAIRALELVKPEEMSSAKW